MVGKHIGIDLPYDEPIEVVKDAPQQEAGSVDCGAVVLYAIHKHICHEPVLKKSSAHELKEMRADIVNTLLLWGRDGGGTMPKRMRLDDGAGPYGT